MPDDHYDIIVIVIGSGPGGGSLAHRLAPTGKRILMVERGEYLPRSRENWNAKTVFVAGSARLRRAANHAGRCQGKRAAAPGPVARAASIQSGSYPAAVK